MIWRIDPAFSIGDTRLLSATVDCRINAFHDRSSAVPQVMKGELNGDRGYSESWLTKLAHLIGGCMGSLAKSESRFPILSTHSSAHSSLYLLKLSNSLKAFTYLSIVSLVHSIIALITPPGVQNLTTLIPTLPVKPMDSSQLPPVALQIVI